MPHVIASKIGSAQRVFDKRGTTRVPKTVQENERRPK